MRFFVAFFSFLLIVSTPVFAVTEPATVENDLIRVSAEKLEADEINRSITFYGKVRVRQAGMDIYADKITLYYQTDKSEEVDRVEIDGRLRIVQDDRVATADHGLFLNRQGQVLLTGNAEVHQAGSSVSGDEIIYFINEARSIVKSQPDSRVNAVFRPGEKQ